MPKFGRPAAVTTFEVKSNETFVPQSAPFGTDFTPSMQYKIVGGRGYRLYDNGNDSVYISPRQDVTEKPNNINPIRRLGDGPPVSRITADQDVNNLHIDIGLLSSSKLLDNLNTESGVEQLSKPRRRTDKEPAAVPLAVLPHTNDPTSLPQVNERLRYLYSLLPTDSYVTAQPFKLLLADESLVMAEVYKALRHFNVRSLKEIYLALTGFDPSLTGCLMFEDLMFTFKRHQLHLDLPLMRLIGSMFISPNAPGKVLYEKVVSFISSSIKTGDHKSMSQNASLPEQLLASNKPVSTGPLHSLMAPSEPVGPVSDSQLIRMAQDELSFGENSFIELERLRSMFIVTDKGRRGTLSADMIREICQYIQLPLSDSLFSAILERCRYRLGQYDYQHFLELLERIVPQKSVSYQSPSRQSRELARSNAEQPEHWPLNDGVRPASILAEELPAPRMPPAARDERWHNPDDTAAHRVVQDRLDNLERQYQNLRQQVINDTQQLQEPWFDRFLKLANAVYKADNRKTSFLPIEEVRWLVHEYNAAYQLGFDRIDFEALLKRYIIKGRVAIDDLLKEMSMFG